MRSRGRAISPSSEMGFGRTFPRIGQKVTEVLCERLPSDVARRLQVRVYQHPSPGGQIGQWFSLGPRPPGTSPSREAELISAGNLMLKLASRLRVLGPNIVAQLSRANRIAGWWHFTRTPKRWLSVEPPSGGARYLNPDEVMRSPEIEAVAIVTPVSRTTSLPRRRSRTKSSLRREALYGHFGPG